MLPADENARALAERVLARDQRGVARAMRWVDDRTPGFLALLRLLYPHTGRAHVLGVTGTPGAGKSTLVDRLVEAYRGAGRTVGVVAVDPTSPFSGGAILGDRIRMQRHFLDAGVFIRSLATRGHLGGLSRSASDVIRVLDAAGYDVVIVETVGVGQDELDVAKLAHSTVVVVPPGLGDDIQAIKAGILEVATHFAVNKADRDGADATVRDLEQMLALGEQLVHAAKASPGHSAALARGARVAAADDTGWHVPVLKTVATRNDGVGALVESLAAHREHLATTAAGVTQRERRLGLEFDALLREQLWAAVEAALGPRLGASKARVLAREVDPYEAAEELVREAVRR